MHAFESIARARRAAWSLAAVIAIAACPTAAQNVQQLQRVQTAPRMATPAADLAVKDYQAMHAKEVEKNKALRAELDAANGRIGEMTRLGGSLVQAHCAAPSLSRNTAGAENNCGAAGYACEPVSGLCRTSCQTSDMCGTGFLCDTGAQQCVPRP